MSQNLPAVPAPSAGDSAYAVAKAFISALPAVGGPALELFQFLVQSPLDRRRNAWMEDVAVQLDALRSRGLDIGRLQNDEVFTSAVLRATQAALKTHQTEKLHALRNAVLNIALGRGPEETLQHLLLNYIDDMTEMHLRILFAVRAPKPPPGLMIGALGDVLEHMIPQLRGQAVLYNQLWRDLFSRGLLNTENLNTSMSESGLAQPRTGELGSTLIRLIEDPL